MNKKNDYVELKQCTQQQVDAVILAGGKAQAMQGMNKLLQKFGNQIQLLKLHRILKTRTANVMISSHRDHSIYKSFIPHIQCFKDDIAGSKGALVGMKTAWRYTHKDYIFFVPCDIAVLPKSLLIQLFKRMQRHSRADVCYAVINDEAVYSLCLMHRRALVQVNRHVEQEQYSLKQCYGQLHSLVYRLTIPGQLFNHIKTLSQWQQFNQIQAIQ